MAESTKAGHAFPGAVDLSDKEFEMFRRLIFDMSGINLNEGKKELVRTRLGKRLRTGGFGSYMDYYKFVKNDISGAELVSLLDAISTNLTSFFREMGHFDFLKRVIIPELAEKKRATGDMSVRVWSAGCSTGEEPYSLAFTLMDNLETIQTWDVKILASDLSTQVLGKASRGLYTENQIKTVPKETLRKYFDKEHSDDAPLYRIKPEVRQLIQFKRFNLMSPSFPFKRKFEFIFCRNVMIYFDKPTQQTLVNKFYDVLAVGGYLLIGHSESLTGVQHRFKYVQPTVYRKMAP
ncbi:MAG: protein-glutamate O-methyltransferase [Nitrospinae bacterium]|nr:protein-glutamate O-methyltransferase [Nitrospinota bacterium]